MVIGSNMTNFINYIYHFAMGRLLGPESYGELVAMISLTGLISMVPGSLALVVVKYISSAKNDEEVEVFLSWLDKNILKISLFVIVLGLLLSPFIASYLKIQHPIFVGAAILSLLFTLPSTLYRSAMQGLLQFKQQVASILAENLIRLVLGVILVWIGLSVFGAVVGLLIATMIGWLVSRRIISKYLVSKGDFRKNIRPLIGYSFPVLLQSVAITSLLTSDLILVKHFFSGYESGIYAAISSLGKIIFYGTAPIGAVMFPIVAKRFSRNEKFYMEVIASLVLTSSAVGVVLMGYLLFPDLAITMLYGDSYKAASGLLFWFGLYIGIFAISSLLISLNLSLGKTRVIVFPLAAAILQLVGINLFHASIFQVILVSIIVSGCMLVSLAIYSSLIFIKRDDT